MSSAKLTDYINKAKHNTKPPVDWGLRLEIWQRALASLYEDVESFLASYLETGEITIKKVDNAVYEENLGDYKADALQVDVVNQQVLLKPVGTLIIGSSGRVDMIGPKGEAVLILVNSREDMSLTADADLNHHTWARVFKQPRVRMVELTKETFIDALLTTLE